MLAPGNCFHELPAAAVGKPCSDPSSPIYYEPLSDRREHQFEPRFDEAPVTIYETQGSGWCHGGLQLVLPSST